MLPLSPKNDLLSIDTQWLEAVCLTYDFPLSHQEAKKWQDRKEALEQLQKLTDNPKIENGDFGAVIRVLIKVSICHASLVQFFRCVLQFELNFIAVVVFPECSRCLSW